MKLQIYVTQARQSLSELSKVFERVGGGKDVEAEVTKQEKKGKIFNLLGGEKFSHSRK